MKTIQLILLSIIFITVLNACKDNNLDTYVFTETATTDFDDIWTLEKIGTKEFDLDSTIGIRNPSVHYFTERGVEKLSIFNPLDLSIHIYDYQTGQIIDKIKFEFEGENGVGNRSSMGHYMDRSDSIFLFNHWENRVYLLNNKAEVLNRYNVADTTLNYQFYMEINSSTPAFKKKDELYIATQTFGYPIENAQALITLNLKTSEVKRHINGPAFLDQAFWGPVTPYTFSLAYDAKRSSFVSSVAKDPFVRRHSLKNLNTTSATAPLGSKLVTSFNAFPKKDDKPDMYGYNYMEIAGETNKKALFLSIIRNESKDLYYRMLVLPRTDDEYKLGVKGMTRTVIISDGQFKKAGEFTLPTGAHKLDFHFMNDQGLHLVNLNEFDKNEDKLVFDIYQAKKR